MTMVRRWLLVALALALVAAGCGSDKGGGSSGGTSKGTSSGTTSGSTSSAHGVTADTIKLGIVMVNYDCIKDFIDFNRGPQQEVAQTIIDDINANGGVAGRKLVPTYNSYCPINNTEALRACTALTEDAKVFAVLGVFIDFSGDAQLCLTRDHKTIHIGHELRKEWIDQAPPGLLLTPDITAERRVQVLATLLGKKGTMKGKKIAVLGDQDTKGPIESTIKPAFEKIGVEQGSTAILNVSGPADNPAALAQLDSFMEKWKQEGVDAVLLSGQRVEAKAFVDKLKSTMPKLQLLADQPSGVEVQAKDAVSAGQKPNPYEGILSTDGQTQQERWKDKGPLLQRCVDVVAKKLGKPVPGPDEVAKGPGGKRNELYIAVEDFCSELNMFKSIADKAGKNLNNDNWTTTVNGFGHITLSGDKYASLHTGKYDAQDGFRLIAFDSSIGKTGDWKPLTPVEDTAKSS